VLAAGNADDNCVACTSASGVPTVAGLSRDDFAQTLLEQLRYLSRSGVADLSSELRDKFPRRLQLKSRLSRAGALRQEAAAA